MIPIYLPPGVAEGPAYGTDEWKEARRGRVTASRFGDVMTEPKTMPAALLDKFEYLVDAPRYRILKSGANAGEQKQVEGYGELVKTAMAGQGLYHWGDTAKSYMMEVMASTITEQDKVGGKSAAMERGVDKESDAIDAYAAAKFTEVAQGRLLLRTSDLIAATPDGFVEEDEDGPGLIEVKCPESKRHLETWLSRELPSDYLEQVQGQMWVAGRSWCDFVSYDDRFPVPMRLVIIRVHRDEEYLASLKAKVTAFAQEVGAKLAQIRGFLADASPEEARTVVEALQDGAEPLTSQPEG